MPNHIGVAVQNSTDAVIQCADLLVKQLGHRNDLLMLKVDLRNAFNMLDRNVILQEVRAHFPGMSRWVHSCYNQQPILFHGEHRIASACGTQQGDPIASLLFCLGLHRITTAIREKCPDLKLNLWHMDDGYIAGDPDSIAAVIHILQEQGPPLGMELRPDKCTLWWPTPLAPSTLPNALQQFITKGALLKFGNGITVLNAPIGSDQYKKEYTEKVAAEARECHSRLSLLDNAQIELGLLRTAVGYPKMHYTLRAVDPKLPHDACVQCDNSQRQALQEIAAATIDNDQWTIATLPLSKGGLGIRQTESSAEPAHLASRLAAAPIIQEMLPPSVSAPVEEWTQAADDYMGCYRHAPRPKQPDRSQRGLSKWETGDTIAELISEASNPYVRARLKAGTLSHTNAWVTALPNDHQGANIHSRACRCIIRLKLGVKQLPANPPAVCPLCHQESIDPEGQHLLVCPKGGLSHRHSLMREEFAHSATSAGLRPRIEAPHLLPGSERRPGDVTIPAWPRGKPAAFDVSVISPMQTNMVAHAAVKAGAAAEARHSEKLDKYEADCKRQGIDFVPIAVETTGGWSEGSLLALKQLSQRIADVTNKTRSDASKELFERISVVLQRANAEVILQALDILRGQTLPTLPHNHYESTLFPPIPEGDDLI